jgi:deferrochelatase/peroxidase EfeB
VDFTVTKSYLAQKSSFGLTPKSTTINLDGYKDIFGNSIIKDTDLEDIMVLDESAYAG